MQEMARPMRPASRDCELNANSHGSPVASRVVFASAVLPKCEHLQRRDTLPPCRLRRLSCGAQAHDLHRGRHQPQEAEALITAQAQGDRWREVEAVGPSTAACNVRAWETATRSIPGEAR